MDIMSRIPAGTEKDPAFQIKDPASLSPWFSLRKYNEFIIMESKEILKKGSSYKTQINANIGRSEKGG